ncbi:uncharacterized protein LOC131633155 [Vicia villosa]|uniref:uncharacterized protein LOC131633155 n=1 Tax=Vicia villosa TaxID=3911 RepID=UPI00273B0865|nr:uncharacterized protein LOC131633155 [Vicia villosa]
MECFHWMKNKKKGKKGTMALKLDMSKAYDRIEWEFVEGALKAMEFPDYFTQLIKRCISTVTYQILLNGQPSRKFFPQRGLRQGDPLSPFLFIICADAFAGLLKRKAASAEIHGILVARKAPVITHLFFADDCLLFGRANEGEADVILQTIHEYQKASGQMVNFEKSEVSFSPNVSNASKEVLRQRLGFKAVGSHIKYLGLPVVFGRKKKEVFSMVIDRVWKKVKGWKEGFLSRAGKEVLIKAVAQSIPTYIMSCYRLPDSCCKEIETILSRFWWGSKEGENKIHWMSWKRMAHSKDVGGMGFRGIKDFNTSLLGKQFWRLMQEDGSLFERFFKGRYYPRGRITEAPVGFKPSYAWRSLLSAKDVVVAGSRWRVGNGDKINVWRDNWVPSTPGFKPLIWQDPTNHLMKVSELIDEDLGQWNRTLILDTFMESDAHHVLSIHLSRTLPEDKLIWNHDKDGEFTVKTAYQILSKQKFHLNPGTSADADSSVWKKLWKLPLQEKIKNFMWRLLKNILPTRTNLNKKAKEPWTAQVVCTGLWKLWQARNNSVFKGEVQNPQNLASSIFDSVLEWNDSRNSVLPNPSVQASVAMANSSWVVQSDAGCFEGGVVALGCIVKSSEDKILTSACQRFSSSTDVAIAELMSITWAIQIALEHKLDNIIFQSDALSVVDCINGTSYSANLELLVNDCKELLRNFQNAVVVYLNRNCNRDAHHMVHVGFNVGSKCWAGVIPPLEVDSVSLDSVAPVPS